MHHPNLPFSGTRILMRTPTALALLYVRQFYTGVTLSHDALFELLQFLAIVCFARTAAIVLPQWSKLLAHCFGDALMIASNARTRH